MSPAPARSRRRDARRAPGLSRRPSVENLEHRLLLAAQLLGDLNPQGAASGPEGFGSVERHFAHLGDVTYFTADDGAHGTELWKADRTTGDVSLVRDLVPGAEPSSPLGLTVFRDALWFLALDDTERYQLFHTDGTAAGTAAVSEDVEVVTDYNRADLTTSVPMDVSGDALYFYGRTDEDGIGVYRTDGAPGSLTRLKDLSAGADPTPQAWYAYAITDFNGRAVFTTPEGVFVTDGTAGDTRLVYENVNGPHAGMPAHFTVVGDTLFFSGIPRDRDAGYELMKTDGTPQGTTLVKDVWPGMRVNVGGPNNSSPYNLTNVDGTLFFYAESDAGYEPWRSDGTEQGTVMIRDINPGWFRSGMPWADVPASPEQSLAVHDGVVYFRADHEEHGIELWRSDTTAEGTFRVFGDDSPLGEGGVGLPVVSGDRLYFAGTGGLWRLHLETGDAARVFDGNARSLSAAPGGGVAFSGAANQDWRAGPPDYEPYFSDGTREGTRRLADVNRDTNGSYPRRAVELSNGTVVFLASAGFYEDLFRTDGTPAGTERLGLPGEWRWPQSLTSAGDIAYFGLHYDGTYGLFKTDGTRDGTTLVKSFELGDAEDPFRILSFTPTGDGHTAYFQAHTTYSSTQLWITDGTEAGTRLIKDLGTSAQYEQAPAYPDVIHNGELYFTAAGPETGPELWRTDGTPAGTEIVRDLNPGPEGGGARSLFTHNGVLYFTSEGANGPWRFRLDPDGQIFGLGPASGEDEPETRFAVVGDRVYAAEPYFDGWRLEGTVAGWGPDGSHIVTLATPEMVVYNDKLYFVAIDNAHGAELWSADRHGFARLVKDVYPGEIGAFQFDLPYDQAEFASPPLMTVAAGKLYFVARDRDPGRHLFVTDGTAEGTRVAAVTDQRSPGVPGSMPEILLGTDDNLYFASNHYRFGRELFGLHSDATPPRVTSAAWRAGAAGMEFAVTFSEDVGDSLNTFDFRLARETATGLEEYDTGLLRLSYDAATRTATLRPQRPLSDSSYVLSVPDGSAITDAAHNPLAPRELLRFSQVALAGDVTGDGRVDALDVAAVKRRLGAATGDANYDPSADLNGDGRVNALDVAAVKRRLGARATAVVSEDF